MTSSPFRSMLQAIPEIEPPRFVGIYFLIDGEEIVYVGQSVNVPQRIIAHQSTRHHRYARWRTKWDRALWIPVDEKDLDAYEGAVIRRLTPRFNTGAPSNDDRDEEICTALSLPPRDLARLAVFLDRRRVSYAEPGKKRVADGRARKKYAAQLRKLGVPDIDCPWARSRRVKAAHLWRAVLPFLEATA